MEERVQKGDAQIQVSRGFINSQIRGTDEPIHGIKLKNERLQKDSKQHQELRRLERYNQIQSEAISANKKNAALEMRWSELKDIQECEELNEQIDEQKDIFGKIIQGKNDLIQQFWDEFRQKEDDYSQTIKEQANDIKEMIIFMRNQFTTIRQHNLQELKNIESQFDEERKAMLETYQTEINNLFTQHEKLEEKYVTDAKSTQESNMKEIQKLRIDGAKSFAELKISMETEIQNLEKCYEDMRALYQLNTEKLEYNLKVLKEKHEENNDFHEDLKRRDLQLNNRLRKLYQDYHSFDQKFKLDNQQLTQEYKRITAQFKELQRKFKHFDKADTERYLQIQKMNEEQVRKLQYKIIKCDTTIHVQQLGIAWEPHTTEQEEEKIRKEQERLRLEELNLQNEKFQWIVSEQRLSEIVDMVMEEADFLIDDKLREESEQWPKLTKMEKKLEIIKKCLNIDSDEEMNEFIKDFVFHCRAKQEEEKQEPTEEELAAIREQQEKERERELALQNQKDQQQKQGKQAAVDPEPIIEPEVPLIEEEKIDYENDELCQYTVIKYLIWSMENEKERKTLVESKSTKQTNKVESERDRKEKLAKEGKRHWDNLTKVLPDRTFRVWKILDKSLSKYYELLLKRQKLIQETGDLHNQNEELKNLLNQYLQINHQLIIPPTRLINLEQPEN